VSAVLVRIRQFTIWEDGPSVSSGYCCWACSSTHPAA